MPSFLIACVLVLGIACWVSFARGAEKGSTAESRDSVVAPPVTATAVQSMSRQELEKELLALERKKAPEPKMGAMCYDMAVNPARIEYVCPVCGEKTLYAEGPDWMVGVTVEETRRGFAKVNRLKKLAMNLDERNLCKKCRPNAKTRDLALTIRDADGSSNTVAAVSAADFDLLEAFLKGQSVLKTFNEGEEPLKSHLPRLRELLDVKEK
jgi:hypothetical protein